MIVSRGGASTLTNSLNHTNSTITTAIHGGHQAIHGSVLSLPYSSRTQLTYNSTNSTQRSSGRSCDADTLEYPPMRLPQPPLIHNEVDYEDEEPPYETIPSVPPNINITLNEQFGVSWWQLAYFRFFGGDGKKRIIRIGDFLYVFLRNWTLMNCFLYPRNLSPVHVPLIDGPFYW